MSKQYTDEEIARLKYVFQKARQHYEEICDSGTVIEIGQAIKRRNAAWNMYNNACRSRFMAKERQMKKQQGATDVK